MTKQSNGKKNNKVANNTVEEINGSAPDSSTSEKLSEDDQVTNKPYVVRDASISEGGSYILKDGEYTKQEQNDESK